MLNSIPEPTTPPVTGTSGTIELHYYGNDHDQTWSVNSYCEFGVRIISEAFSTEGGYDPVTIDGGGQS